LRCLSGGQRRGGKVILLRGRLYEAVLACAQGDGKSGSKRALIFKSHLEPRFWKGAILKEKKRNRARGRSVWSEQKSSAPPRRMKSEGTGETDWQSARGKTNSPTFRFYKSEGGDDTNDEKKRDFSRTGSGGGCCNEPDGQNGENFASGGREVVNSA